MPGLGSPVDVAVPICRAGRDFRNQPRKVDLPARESHWPFFGGKNHRELFRGIRSGQSAQSAQEPATTRDVRRKKGGRAGAWLSPVVSTEVDRAASCLGCDEHFLMKWSGGCDKQNASFHPRSAIRLPEEQGTNTSLNVRLTGRGLVGQLRIALADRGLELLALLSDERTKV